MEDYKTKQIFTIEKLETDYFQQFFQKKLLKGAVQLKRKLLSLSTQVNANGKSGELL